MIDTNRLPLETLQAIARNGRTSPGEARAIAAEMLERVAESRVQCASLRPAVISAIARTGQVYTYEARALADELIARRALDPKPEPTVEYNPYAYFGSLPYIP